MMGPALEITALPGFRGDVAAVFDEDLGTDLLLDAVRALVDGGEYPALAGTVLGLGPVLLCASETHFHQVAEELEDLGASWSPLGWARLVGPCRHRLCCRPDSRLKRVELAWMPESRRWVLSVTDDDGRRRVASLAGTKEADRLGRECARHEGVPLLVYG